MANFVNYVQILQLLQQIKQYVDTAEPANVVNSITVNGGEKVTPDENGNANLTINIPDVTNFVTTDYSIWIQNQYGREYDALSLFNSNYGKSDPIATKSYVDQVASSGGGTVKSVSINNGTQYGPDSAGNVNLLLQTYTLELDKKDASVTASIDNGDPVSPDTSNNINLNVPRTYCKKIRTPYAEYEVEDNYTYTEEGEEVEVINDHIIDIRNLGKPRFNTAIRQKELSGTISTITYIQMRVNADADFEMTCAGAKIRWFNGYPVEINGPVFIINGDGTWYVGAKGAARWYFSINFSSTYVYITADDETTYRLAPSYNDFEKFLTNQAKSFSKADMSTLMKDNSILRWYYVGDEFRDSSLSNTNFPRVKAYPSKSNSKLQYDSVTDQVFIWFGDTINDASKQCGIFEFDDWFEGSFTKDGHTNHPIVRILDTTFHKTVWKTFSVRIRSTNDTTTAQKVHVEFQDQFGNKLFDVILNPCYLGTGNYGTVWVTNGYFAVKNRVMFNEDKARWIVKPIEID